VYCYSKMEIFVLECSSIGIWSYNKDNKCLTQSTIHRKRHSLIMQGNLTTLHSVCPL
jgi:hypothetical protein